MKSRYRRILNIGGSCSVYAEPFDTIRVTIKQIRALDDSIDNGSDADFYAKVTINRRLFNNEDSGTQDSLEGRNEIAPNWEFSNQVDVGASTLIPITIQIWDEDGGFNGPDDFLDISSSATALGISMTLDLSNCTFTLDPGFGTLDGSSVGNCGQQVSVTGDGKPDSEGRVFLSFVIDAEISANAASLRVNCTHNPLIPNRGEEVTVSALTLDNTSTPVNASQVEVWFLEGSSSTTPPVMSTGTPSSVCSSNSTCTYSRVPNASSITFSYGCIATLGTQQVWSGWKTATIDMPVGERPIPVIRTGHASSRVDIVFIPDANSYESTSDRQFHSDVQNLIRNGYFREDVFLANQDHFNFWISRSTGRAAEAVVSDCDHAPPSDWDDQYAFADVGVIVHTWGPLTRPQDRFRNCALHSESYVSAPAAFPRVMLHETGLTPFGLADEYCCDGGYFEADPPNIYKEYGADLLENCRADLANLGRAGGCRLIVSPGTLVGTSIFNFSGEWSTSEPPDSNSNIGEDLMNDNGPAQAADLRRINRVFRACESARC